MKNLFNADENNIFSPVNDCAERKATTLDDLLERYYRPDITNEILVSEIKEKSECEKIFGKSYFPNLQEDLDLLTIRK